MKIITALLLSNFILQFISAQIPIKASDSLPLTTIIEIKIASPLHPNTLNLIHAIPALFGNMTFKKFHAPMYFSRNGQSCTKSKIKLPILSESDQELLLKEYPGRNYTNPKYWIAALERGNCAFDQKVLVSQENGFMAALIYNFGVMQRLYPSQSDFDDLPIRMSGNTLGSKIQIPSFFSTFKEVQKLLGYSLSGEIMREIPKVFVVSVEVVSYAYSEWGWAHYASAILFWISLVLLVSSLGMSAAIGWRVARVYYGYEQEYEHVFGSRKQARLVKVDFPIRVFGENECGDLCCAICIDDFEAGSRARLLPCGHMFHTEW